MPVAMGKLETCLHKRADMLFLTYWFVLFACVFLLAPLTRAQNTDERSPRKILSDAIARWAELIEPAEDAQPQTLVANVKLVKADGLPDELGGLSGWLLVALSVAALGPASAQTYTYGQPAYAAPVRSAISGAFGTLIRRPTRITGTGSSPRCTASRIVLSETPSKAAASDSE